MVYFFSGALPLAWKTESPRTRASSMNGHSESPPMLYSWMHSYLRAKSLMPKLLKILKMPCLPSCVFTRIQLLLLNPSYQDWQWPWALLTLKFSPNHPSGLFHFKSSTDSHTEVNNNNKYLGVPSCGSVGTKLTSIHGFYTPGLTQWVKDPGLARAVV